MTEMKKEGARFSPQRVKRHTNICCVYGCTSRAQEDHTLRFHHFPVHGNTDLKRHWDVHAEAEKKRRFQTWLTNLRIKEKYLFNTATVCSLHFTREDYVLPDVLSLRRLLRNTAVPTLNLPTLEQSDAAEAALEAAALQKEQRRVQIEEEERIEMEMEKKRQEDQLLGIKQEPEDPISIEEFFTVKEVRPAKKKYPKKKKKKNGFDDPLVDPLMQTEEVEGVEKEKKTKRKGKTIGKNAKKQKYVEVVVKEEHEYAHDLPIISKDNYVDIGVQAESVEIALKLSDFLTTDKELSTLTGVPNFEILGRIVEAVKMVYPEKRIVANLDTRDKVLMTLMKLKHDMPYSVLSSLFKCARIALCRNMIYNTLTKLSNVLRYSIEFPTMEALLASPQECFKDFNNVRVVIDRVEIAVQKPNNLCCQLALFSHSNNYSVKFMTGFTPAGRISFVSKAYSGRASDSSIFEHSKIVEQLSSGEAILTGRDLAVESICSEYGVKLVRPILGTHETFQNDKIAKALVHVDETNQRLKMFQVFSTRVPLSLIKKCEDILIIAAAIVNINPQYRFR